MNTNKSISKRKGVLNVGKGLKYEIGDTLYIIIYGSKLIIEEVEVEEINLYTGNYELRVKDLGDEYILSENYIYKTREEAENKVREKIKG